MSPNVVTGLFAGIPLVCGPAVASATIAFLAIRKPPHRFDWNRLRGVGWSSLRFRNQVFLIRGDTSTGVDSVQEAKGDWIGRLESDFVCLIGSGDSRKSTILDAIDLALGPRSRIDFDDSDFYQLKTDNPLTVTASVTGFPDDLLGDKKFGLYLTGYKNGECHDEMQDGDEPMLTVRLAVDKSLEPEWMAINRQHPEGRFVTAKDREKLGVMRLGSYVNQHLTWRRGTALARLTGEPDDIDAILAEASRSARQNIPADALVNFQEAAKKAEELGRG